MKLEELQFSEGANGEKVEYTNYEDWKNALPKNHRIFKNGQIERARTIGQDIDSIIGQFDRTKNAGFIYGHFTNSDK